MNSKDFLFHFVLIMKWLCRLNFTVCVYPGSPCATATLPAMFVKEDKLWDFLPYYSAISWGFHLSRMTTHN